tara:strand:- start:41 stop:949 length:909 start_codon:yes stop_codon:yes gene_type:complete
MATIQIRGVQIQDASINPAQINQAATFDFSSGVVSVATPSAAAHAATKAYVDAQVPDTFSGGDGILITDADPDVISVDLATNPGMQFTSSKLDLKIKSETGGSITKDADGIYIGDAAIANGKLANSTISGKALGTNLDALAAGQGLALASPFNGSAGQTMDLNLDGSTLAKGVSGVKISDLGVGSGQLAADAVIAGKIADGAVDASSALVDGIISEPKLSFQSRQDIYTPNGSTLAFVLANEVNPLMDNFVMAFKNGLLMRKVASSPSDVDSYTVSTAGGATTITFGANLSSDDALEVRSLA